MRLYPIKLYLKALPNMVLLPLSALANLCIWLSLLWYIRPQSEFIFLHYNVLFGVDYIGPWWMIFLLPLSGLLILFAHAILGWFFHEKDPFIGYLCNAMTLFLHLFLGIAAYLLVFLNV